MSRLSSLLYEQPDKPLEEKRLDSGKLQSAIRKGLLDIEKITKEIDHKKRINKQLMQTIEEATNIFLKPLNFVITIPSVESNKPRIRKQRKVKILKDLRTIIDNLSKNIEVV